MSAKKRRKKGNEAPDAIEKAEPIKSWIFSIPVVNLNKEKKETGFNLMDSSF